MKTLVPQKNEEVRKVRIVTKSEKQNSEKDGLKINRALRDAIRKYKEKNK